MMKVEEKEFFIRTTLKICGSLDIEEALFACLKEFGRVIPADQVYLARYRSDTQAVHIFAVADSAGGRKSALKFPMPKTVGDGIMASAGVSEVYVVNDPSTHPIIKHTLSLVGEDASVMVLRLVLEKTFIGAFVVRVQGKHRYTEAHARLLELLKAPFGIAFTNYQRYREVLRLKELLADDNRYLKNEIHRMTGDEIIGADFGLRDVMRLVRQVAPLDSPVLLLGETGTGKEVMLRRTPAGKNQRSSRQIT